MINHARCLLANLPPANGSDYLAEEIVDPSFMPLDPLPVYTRAARRMLFGATPDRHMVNYRCRQLLTAVHASPLVEFVTDLDPRLTYAVGEDTTLVSPALFTPVITGPANLVTIIGQPFVPDLAGQVAHSYRLTVAGSALTVTCDKPVSNLVFGLQPGPQPNGPFPLAGSGYLVLLAGTVVDGDAWTVELKNRPQWNLGQLTAGLASLAQSDLDALFVSPVDPYVTFGNFWRRGPDIPSRLSGLLLAIVYRSDHVYRGLARATA